MKRADEVRTEHKLDTITHYLLKAFPGAAIQAARVNGGDSLLTVRTPHVISPCILRIPRAFLNEAHPTGEEIPVLFDHLQLPRVLGERRHYDLTPITLPDTPTQVRAAPLSDKPSPSV
jgi:hypothetical protein